SREQAVLDRRCTHVDRSIFFFSSRRRHTISKRDWSSDVCSSDLVLGIRLMGGLVGRRSVTCWLESANRIGAVHSSRTPMDLSSRSEERRGGKEGRGTGEGQE